MTLDKLKVVLKVLILIVVLVITIMNNDVDTLGEILKMIVADLLE